MLQLKQDGSEGLPVRDDNPADCTVSTVSCRFAAGDVRNSEQGKALLFKLSFQLSAGAFKSPAPSTLGCIPLLLIQISAQAFCS